MSEVNVAGELALLLEQLRNLGDDPEGDHSNGDEILCTALLLLGSNEDEKKLTEAIVREFEALSKWYA